MKRAVIVATLRTPFAPMGKELAAWDAAGLAAVCMRELLARHAIAPDRIDEVILGCAGQPIDAANIARVAALRSGLAVQTPALTIQRNCASSLDAVAAGARAIECGNAELVLAGGVEHMSSYPLLFRDSAAARFRRLARARTTLQRVRIWLGMRPRHFAPLPALLAGMRDPACGLSMGQTAEVLAHRFKISRAMQDEFALESQRRAARARAARTLAGEIMMVAPPPDHARILDDDTGIREGASLEKLAALAPVFDREHGSVSAGNSSQLTDGAAMVLLASEARAAAEGWNPIGRIRAYVAVGVEPRAMGLGPVTALPLALARASVAFDDCAVIEVNEAFAAQVLACLAEFKERGLEIARERLNPNGGAIARGHPLGATGARLVGAVLGELGRQRAKIGAVTLCVGGGQGAAMILESLS